MKTKREPIKAPVQYIRHADAICSDCGNTGCLIPVPHKVVSRSQLKRINVMSGRPMMEGVESL